LDKPLVSVIIPAFNAAADIRQALHSVVTQTYRAIEVIVVDDGSSDATAAIVEEFISSNHQFQLIRQSNAGVGAARNAAIRKARGKYIAPLDADDFWLPDKLEKQVACMERSGEETGLVYCWFKLIDEHNELLAFSPPCRLEGRLRHALILVNLLGNASVPLFRAAALENVGLYLTRAEQGGAQGCEDWDLALRIAERFIIRVVPECLVAYRQNNSTMTRNTEGMVASFAMAKRRARRRNRDLPAASFRWSDGYFYAYLAEKCYGTGSYSRSLRYLRKAVFANPVFLLKASVCKTFLRSVFKLNRPTNKASERAAVRSNEKASVRFKKIRKLLSILDAVFRRFELARWDAASQDGV
jgi:glycosyltransferase involved in cell wall biosynthesis